MTHLDMLLPAKVAQETSIKAPVVEPSEADANNMINAKAQVGQRSAVDMKPSDVPASRRPQKYIPPIAKQSAMKRLCAVKLAFDLGQIGQSLGNAGKSVSEAVGGVGKAIGDYKPLADSNIVSNALMGAGAGGLIGAHGEKDEESGGRKHRLRNALLGMVTGAAAGGAVGPLAKTVVKNRLNARHQISESVPGGKLIQAALDKMRNTSVDIAGEGATNRDLFQAARQGISDGIRPK